MVDKPNPGSDDAVKSGCSCPIEDNDYGRGTWTDGNGISEFWISSDCPLHGSETTDGLTEPAMRIWEPMTQEVLDRQRTER